MLAATIMIAALAAINPRLLRVERPDLGRLVILGVVGMAFSTYTYYFALQRIPAAITALLTYTAPLLVLGASVFLYPEPLLRSDVPAVIATYSVPPSSSAPTSRRCSR